MSRKERSDVEVYLK